ncbi:MAG: hypothetical protein HFJ25_03275 [Clostridia bacterium]|nr:hypothetical protein [Clostridia bacterium]MCI9080671.1 hypothetical protein [Lachnospiraceae bacterium]
MNRIICPYCGKQLIQGYIQSPRPISWLPKKLKLFTLAGFKGKEAVVLSEGKCLSAPCVIAYNCRECKKIIIDYEGNCCDFYR